MRTWIITALIALNLLLFIVAGQAQTKGPGPSPKPVTTPQDSMNQVIQERVFFLAQKMAIQGDIRIKKDPKTKKWRWIKSPWNNGKQPIYKPTEADSR